MLEFIKEYKDNVSKEIKKLEDSGIIYYDIPELPVLKNVEYILNTVINNELKSLKQIRQRAKNIRDKNDRFSTEYTRCQEIYCIIDNEIPNKKDI